MPEPRRMSTEGKGVKEVLVDRKGSENPETERLE